MITCIVSTYKRPLALRCCLASLALQSPPVLVFVTDNDPARSAESETREFGRYVNTATVGDGTDPCDAANALVASDYIIADDDWLCFPSDDSYYVPLWSRIVLDFAATRPHLEFIYWDVLYDPRRTGKYEVMPVYPSECQIDKTSFIVKRDLFVKIGGFPKRENDGWRDAALAETLVKMGVKHGKAPGCLTVHN